MTNPPTGGSASTSTSEAPPAAATGSPSAPPAGSAARSTDAGKPVPKTPAAKASDVPKAAEAAKVSEGDFGATTLSGRAPIVAGAFDGDASSGPAAPPATPGQVGPGGLSGSGGLAGPAAPLAGPAGEASTGIRGIRTGRNRGPRRARLQIRHINPVTVLKFSCVLAVALFFVWMIVIGVLFGVLDAAGVIGHINDTITQLRGSDAKPPVTAGIVFGGAAIVGVVYIVLFIALSTIGAVIYNLCADLVGGIEVTLSER